VKRGEEETIKLRRNEPARPTKWPQPTISPSPQLKLKLKLTLENQKTERARQLAGISEQGGERRRAEKKGGGRLRSCSELSGSSDPSPKYTSLVVEVPKFRGEGGEEELTFDGSSEILLLRRAVHHGALARIVGEGNWAAAEIHLLIRASARLIRLPARPI
jgi:hypothetical protein